MKKTKLLAALAAGMLISAGAHAAPADSNLGTAVVGASQTGMFGGDNGVSAPMALGIAAIAFALISEELTDYTPEPSSIVPPTQQGLHNAARAHTAP